MNFKRFIGIPLAIVIGNRSTLSILGSLFVVFCLLSPSLLAQWPGYPTQGVPRTPDGKPNLTAPAPRTPDGKPDLSGLWEAARGGGQRGGQRGGAAETPPTPAPTPATSNDPPLATFFEIGAGIPGGPPYTPWAADLKKKRAQDN